MSGTPFPGMDPYLEGEMWMEFHDTLAHEIRGQLLKRLPQKYAALLKRYYAVDAPTFGVAAEEGEQGFYPDVHVVRQLKESTVAAPKTIAPVELISPISRRVPLLRVEVREIPGRRLVTVIEILSPVNKRGKGFRAYLNKRDHLLKSEIHLLEIDLLRAGKRIPFIGELPPASYYVFLSRFTRRPRTEVWPVQLRDPLPALPVPLLPPDPGVPLNLQTAAHACFELVGYERLLDYSQRPPPPELSAEDSQWAQAQIKSLVAE